jgi:hypothetical protein
MTASPIYDEVYTIAQFARTLPPNDSGWTTTTWIDVMDGSEGVGNQLGEMQLKQVFGVRTAQGLGSFFPNGQRRVFVNLGEAPDFGRQGDTGSVNDNLAGAVVRILKAVVGGSVTINGYAFEPFWWGIVRGPISEPDGSSGTDVGGTAGWLCVDIRSVLDQIVLRECWALSPVSSQAVRVGRMLPFNRNPNGDRTADPYDLPGGATYVHSVSTEIGDSWTASDIITYLLSVGATGDVDGGEAVTGWTWAISDTDGVLDYVPQNIDLAGMTVFQAINAIAHQDRGITWGHTVSGDTVTLHFYSVAASAVTVLSETVPASTFTTTLDIRGDASLASVVVREDWDNVYDVIEVRGDRPWMTMTLLLDSVQAVLKGSAHGWLAVLDADWNADPEASSCEDVYRRWRLNNAWNGQQYNNSAVGLRNKIERGTDGGLSGERTYDSTYGIAPAWELDFERLCCSSPSFGQIILAPRQAPVVVAGLTTWEDMSTRWLIQVDTNPPSIRIDDGANGTTIQEYLDAGDKILITLGVREVDPLRVSWHREPGQRPNATPRVKVVTLPVCQQWVVLPDTIKGVTELGALVTTGSLTPIRDDLPAMKAALALLVASFSEPAITVRWADRGTLDISSTYRPGRLLTTLTRGDKVQTINSIITRRTWSTTTVKGEGPNAGDVVYHTTSYDTEHLSPTLSALL